MEGAGSFAMLITNSKTHIILAYEDHNMKSVKSGELRWMWHITRLGEKRKSCNILVENPEGKNNLEYIGIVGRIKLQWILKN
jgi:predicted ATPase